MSNGREKELKELPEVNLEKLIETCTEGLDVVEGDEDGFNMWTVMTGFKQEALLLLKQPTNLETNSTFWKLIKATSENVTRASIAPGDDRVQLAKFRIMEVLNAIQKQRKQLQEQIDTTPVTKAETEEKSTQKRPFSWFKPSTWRQGEAQSSHDRIRQLLSRMQELNS